jgi:hypothetical protein
MRARLLHVIAGLDPAIHPLSKMFLAFCEEDGPTELRFT